MNNKSQAGLSIIELMIAITLGILMSSAMISLFINSKQSYRINENMSRLQENAKFAMTFISRDIRMADYRGCETSDRLDDAIGQTSTGILTLKWQPSGCDASAAIISTEYSIQDVNDMPVLSKVITSDDASVAQQSYEIEGIESMQILYGEEIDADFVPNYYVNSASVADMSQVISVRVTLTARTLEDNIALDGGRITRNLTSTIALRNRLP